MSEELDYKGYVIIATTQDEYRCATTCAYSIKKLNPDASVAMIVDKASNVPEEYEDPFDYIIELPFAYLPVRRTNDWQLYWATPYKYNIALDCFTIVKDNHDELWERLIDHYELAFPVNAKDFKGNPAGKSSQFKDLEITPVNTSAFFFTADNETCLEYFKTADPILTHWEDAVSAMVGSKYVQKYYYSDIMHSILIDRMWDNKQYLTDAFDIVDMQVAREAYDRNIKTSWTDYLNVWVTNNTTVKIQNYNMNSIVSYNDKNVVTQEIYERFKHYSTEK